MYHNDYWRVEVSHGHQDYALWYELGEYATRAEAIIRMNEISPEHGQWNARVRIVPPRMRNHDGSYVHAADCPGEDDPYYREELPQNASEVGYYRCRECGGVW